MLFLAWQFAIKPTIKARKKNKQYKKVQNRAEGAEVQIIQYQKMLTSYDADLENKAAFSRETLLAEVNSFCKNKNIRVNDFADVKMYEEGSYSIQDNELKVQGAFKDMIALIYHLEQESPYYQIVSVNFNKKRDLRNRKEVLISSIRIRHIENKN